jgi:hypothetical protein
MIYLEKQDLMDKSDEHVEHMTNIYTYYKLGDYEFPDDMEGKTPEEITRLRNAALPDILKVKNNTNNVILRRDKLWFKMLILCVVRNPLVQQIIDGTIPLDGDDIFWKEGNLDGCSGNYYSALEEKYSSTEKIRAVAQAFVDKDAFNAIGNYGVAMANHCYTMTEKEVEEIEKILKNDNSNEPVKATSNKRKTTKTKHYGDDDSENDGE